jgi:hypothetical protein
MVHYQMRKAVHQCIVMRFRPSSHPIFAAICLRQGFESSLKIHSYSSRQRFLNTFFSSPWKLLVNAYNMAAHDSSAQPGFLGRQVSLCSFFPNARCLLLLTLFLLTVTRGS